MAGKITIIGLRKLPVYDSQQHLIKRDSGKTATLTFSSDVPPAWLDFDASQLAARLRQLVGRVLMAEARSIV